MDLAAQVEQHHADALRLVAARLRRLGGSAAWARDRAEDAVQDAWAALAARGLREGDRMPGLLFCIALRAAQAAPRGAPAPSSAAEPAVEPGWGGAFTAAGAEAALVAEVGRCEMCRKPMVDSVGEGQRFCSRACRRAARKAKVIR